MSFDLSSITKARVFLPPRVVLLGTPKVGKTTFASKFPNAVLIPVIGEEGADDVTCAKFPTVNTLDELGQALGALLSQKHDFGFVVIDSTTALERVIFKAVCTEMGWKSIEEPGFGKGYNLALQKWDALTSTLDQLRVKRNMGCILIGHTAVKTFNDPMAEPYDAYMWDLNKNAAGLLMKWSDECLFAKIKSFTKETENGKKVHAVGTEHVLLTQERPSHPGGGRGIYGHLPYELKLDYNAWQSAVNAEYAKENPQPQPQAAQPQATK